MGPPATQAVKNVSGHPQPTPATEGFAASRRNYSVRLLLVTCTGGLNIHQSSAALMRSL